MIMNWCETSMAIITVLLRHICSLLTYQSKLNKIFNKITAERGSCHSFSTRLSDSKKICNCSYFKRKQRVKLRREKNNIAGLCFTPGEPTTYSREKRNNLKVYRYLYILIDYQYVHLTDFDSKNIIFRKMIYFVVRHDGIR